jgi:hypothetical protein
MSPPAELGAADDEAANANATDDVHTTSTVNATHNDKNERLHNIVDSTLITFCVDGDGEMSRNVFIKL